MAEHTAAQFVKTRTDAGSGEFVADYSGDDPTKIRTSIGTGHITNLLGNTAAGDAGSIALYGNPSSVYVGMWGTMEIDVDTTTNREQGGTSIRVWLDADTAIPQPANWAAITDLG